ncbi:MAG: clostripain-related cysteine peptidase [Candidatus Dependentiae bacterium]|nr:clostripain-related cysteine peptidase [Candidatus Dependentiae bacterium]
MVIKEIKKLSYYLFYLLFVCTTQSRNEVIDTKTHVERSVSHKANRVKDWTFIVYIAADNNLRNFAARNIKQMSEIGSNDFLNIAVQLDIRITGNKKITRRYYVENNKILHVNSADSSSQQMDSGDPKTLVSCCKWAIENYPARNYALILWNHGTGIIDPDIGRIVNPAELFVFNPNINKFELDRSIGFLDCINDIDSKLYNDSWRGICWDESTGNYLTNQKLDSALAEVTQKFLGGRKLNILGFDACLMGMIEIAEIAKQYAQVMVGSQEVELGPGWDYQRVLEPFRSGSIDYITFAKHMVDVYAETYGKITNDYTQAAINLDSIDALENNINTVATLLSDGLRLQKNGSVKNAIQASKSKLLCTHFDEPSYIDLHHFYTNLLANLKYFTFINEQQGANIKKTLGQALEDGKNIIKSVVIANQAGKNLSLAQGISIYFPERRIHSSYYKTSFAASNKWATLLSQYLLL